MGIERDNVSFQLCSNQSFHRLTPKDQSILTNKIIGTLAKLEVNGPDFVLKFREKMEPQLRSANFEGKGGPYGTWNSIHKQASYLASKELKEQPIEINLEDFCEPGAIRVTASEKLGTVVN